MAGRRRLADSRRSFAERGAGRREAADDRPPESGVRIAYDERAGTGSADNQGANGGPGADPAREADPSRTAGEGPYGAYSDGHPGFGAYLRSHPGLSVAACAVGMLAIVGFLAFSSFVGSGLFGGSGDEQQPRQAAGQQQEPAPGSAGDGLPRAEEVGEVRQDRDGSTVTVSIAPDGGSYRGELSEEEDSLFLESEANSTQASFVSPFAEGESRSWLGQIKDASEENLIVQASQTSDPGPAAREGRTPIMRGSYTVKARDGSLSASGTFEDTFVSPTEVERVYEETYFSSQSGSATPEHRRWRVGFLVEGDPAFVPTLIGYEPPGEARSSDDGSDSDPNGGSGGELVGDEDEGGGAAGGSTRGSGG